MAVAVLEKYLVPDLVSHIFDPICKENMAKVNKEILSIPSIFEKALAQSLSLSKWVDCNDDKANDLALMEILKENHEVRYFHDDYIYWDTEVYLIDDNKFVLIHWQHDGQERDHVIVEGFLENLQVKIERFYYKSWGEESVRLSLDEMMKTCGGPEYLPIIPFQFLLEKMTGKYFDKHMIDLNYHSGKSWQNIKLLVKHYFERD